MATEAEGGKPPKPTVTERADAAVEDDPKVFILSRELSEVHLLLDNLSADPDTTIEALSTRQPLQGLPENWIDQICEISWPPPQSEITKAAQAALLIRAKDYLNRLAKPASGMSIAFTLMVTQKDDEAQPPIEERKPGVDRDEVLWRCSLAANAYPDLSQRAAMFRKWLKGINFFVVGWLVVTCLLSWNVALGNSALTEYAAAKAELVAAQDLVDDLEAGRLLAIPQDASSVPKDGAEESAPARTTLTPVSTEVEKAGPLVAYCERWRLVDAANGNKVREYQSADQLQACDQLADAEKRLGIAESRPSDWVWWWTWVVPHGGDPADAASAAARLASLLGTAVLPVFYGLLGAAAAVLRSLSQKIKASTLTPRDLSLSLQQLALGAVVGACIGLFIVGEDTTLVGPVTLSASAISFVAGFGVEAVFQALEALISRLFNLAPAGTSRAAPPQ